jgi:hypothetical protein
MTLAVETGHVLVLDGEDYPIISAEKWQLTQGTSRSFRRASVLTVSLKKETFSGGKGSMTTYATGVSAMPLDPVSAGLKHTMGLETPHMVKQTYIEVDGEFIHLIVEDLRT